MPDEYVTNQELLKRVEALEAQYTYRIKLTKAALFQLQAGDIVLFKIAAPLATSEVDKLARGWNEMLANAGHPEVQAMFLSGTHTGVDISVLRPEAA